MGMFDSFYLPHQTQLIEVQNKEFACNLDVFHLGDFVSNERGIRFVFDSFLSPSLSLNSTEINSYDGNRHVCFVLLNGQWVDFFVTADSAACRSRAQQLLPLYQQADFRAHLLHIIQRVQYGYAQAQHEGKFQELNRFFNDFQHRHLSKKKSIFASLRQTPKKELTYKKLMSAVADFLKPNERTNPTFFETYQKALSSLAHPAQQDFFYDGPTEPLKPHTRSKSFLSALLSLDVPSLQSFSHIPTHNAKHVTQYIHALHYTFMGQFILATLFESVPLLRAQHLSEVSLSSNTSIDYLTYLTAYLGMEDVAVHHLLSLVPTPTRQAIEQAFLQSGAFYPLTFNALHITPEVVADYQNPTGKGIFALALEQATVHSYASEYRLGIFTQCEFWAPYAQAMHQDQEGNTALLSFLKKMNEQSSQNYEQHQRALFVRLEPLISEHLKHYDFSHVNHLGESLTRFWPQEPGLAFSSVLAREEQARLQGISQHNAKHVTRKVL